MTTAINEACIGRFHENCYLVRGFFWCEKWTNFSYWVGFFPHLQGSFQTVGLGEGTGQSIHGRGNKQDERM